MLHINVRVGLHYYRILRDKFCQHTVFQTTTLPNEEMNKKIYPSGSPILGINIYSEGSISTRVAKPGVFEMSDDNGICPRRAEYARCIQPQSSN